MTVVPPRPPTSAPQEPAPPSLFRLATVLGQRGLSRIRHPGEVPFVIIGAVLFVANWAAMVVLWLVNGGAVYRWLQKVPVIGPALPALIQGTLTIPLLYLIYRGISYGLLRVNSVRMSPTQFPQGYRMVVEAATAAGLRRVPDAYVQLGNGTINAFSAGHGFRRYIVVYSDLFEVGGAARDPAALRFVIGHEIGHVAAGHVGYFRLLVMSTIMQIPVLGSALSRAQEYTADNFGYRYTPDGGTRAMRVLAAGKYLNAQVRVDEFADRATIERGPFVWLANLLSDHPVLTWRTHALRDRSRPGRLFFRPRFTPSAQPTLLSGSAPSRDWPDPSEGDAFLTSYPAANPWQFGVFPPVGGDLPAEGEYGRAELRHGWRRALPPYGGPGGWPPAGPGGYPPGGPGGYPPLGGSPGPYGGPPGAPAAPQDPAHREAPGYGYPPAPPPPGGPSGQAPSGVWSPSGQPPAGAPGWVGSAGSAYPASAASASPQGNAPPGHGASGYGASGYGASGYGASGYGASGYGASGYGEPLSDAPTGSPSAGSPRSAGSASSAHRGQQPGGAPTPSATGTPTAPGTADREPESGPPRRARDPEPPAGRPDGAGGRFSYGQPSATQHWSPSGETNAPRQPPTPPRREDPSAGTAGAEGADPPGR